MMQSTNQLPKNYASSLVLDYEKDQKLNRRMMIASVIMFVGLFLLGNTYLPIYLLAYDDQGFALPLPLIGLKIGILVMIFIFYTLAHEKLRGLLMKRFSGVKSELEFRGAAAYAKSKGYFSKRDFRIISLGPVLILAFLILIATLILPMDWFWVGFIAQILNLAGSMKDFYTAWQVVKQPADVLIYDDGQIQTFYIPASEPVSRSTNRTKAQSLAAKEKQMKDIYRKKKKK